ncbi:hypothetical protein A2852_00380 [Candidatus Adlerbacteria bacterium RIFCSPHIGHO2_01_FULL_54_23]|uniref:DUF5658 domain-containing protein n=3 Tax=Candidatus Adleribacteriota TaxID=1752736 RepID=A0A1F4XZ41_9BACT|nr:MAG: hypothetical protein UY83_C0004G0024 [Candidatus Adlerbacteria bacterium GW2011_GWA1_54_10]KKW37632.1 MAG: hypothetical protein UY86_C0005G0019 [Candidatus Adlerbacteria bacterium GW2011_GWB1_54_7]OGC78660.1 MAG: hypothetical protein A2852_00380 [Candidatus Adlerbacteria bacterium RIFCSPHIGHO2_01_FULL_54_23]OGC86980.1 MAG: hypothetical protein A3B33_03265 [Candidatus Adlerbacteria bacterium RIFCSPLOWO2_01_FULL_54_16]
MKNIRGVLSAAIVTIWTIVVMAIATEIYPAFKAILTSFAGQHWTAKSTISLAVFFVLYLFFRSKEKPRNILSYAVALALSAVIGGAVIFGFYLWHFL